MRERTYRAGTMREALAQVRRDLGGNAVILGTREVRRRRLLGLGARDLIEVTASDGSHARVPVVSTRSTTSITTPTAVPSKAGAKVKSEAGGAGPGKEATASPLHAQFGE